MPTKPEEAAGFWGDYVCDIPPQTMNSMFDFIRDELKPDAAFWLGDSIAHHLDSLTEEDNINSMVKVSRQVQKAFKDIPLWAAIGNHDTYPQDLFEGKVPRQNKAINEWIKSWKEFDFI